MHGGCSADDVSRARQHAITMSMLETVRTVSKIQAMRFAAQDPEAVDSGSS